MTVNTHMIFRRIDAASLHRLERPLWVLSILLATLGIFWVPWRFPSTTPAMGESYSLGFSNRLALVALAGAIAAATAARLVGPRSSRAIEWLAERPRFRPSWRAARTEYLILAASTFVWMQILWAWCTSLVDPAYGDSRGMIYAIDLIALGRVPYRDFVFNYGAAHIYLPYWLSWATDGAISFERAYFAVLMLFVLVGFLSIFVFLRALHVPHGWRALALGLALGSWALFHTSTAHMPTRFMSVPLGLVVLHAGLRKNVASPWKANGLAAVTSGGVVLYCLALSPEMGIAGCIAILGYAFGLAALQKRTPLAAACVAGSIAAVAATLLVFPEYFLTVVAFAGGFGNLPLYPNPQNVLVVGASMFVFSSLIATALRHPDDARAPLALGLSAGGGILLAGCFGRAAPVHVFFNAMIPLLVMFAAASQWPSFTRKAWPAVYFLIEIVLLQISWWWTNYGTCSTAIQLRRIYDANPQVVAAWKAKWDERRAAHPLGRHLHWGSVLPYPDELDRFTQKGAVIQTGGSEWNLWLGRYLLLQTQTPKDFFTPWLLSACTPEQISRRLEDLKQARFLLVPFADFAAAEGPVDIRSYEQQLDQWLGVTMAFPVRCQVRFAPYLPDAAQIKSLLAAYKPLGRFQYFVYMPFMLLERQDDE